MPVSIGNTSTQEKKKTVPSSHFIGSWRILYYLMVCSEMPHSYKLITILDMTNGNLYYAAWNKLAVCEDVSESSALGVCVYKTAVQEAPEMLWSWRTTTEVHNRGLFSSVLSFIFHLSSLLMHVFFPFRHLSIHFLCSCFNSIPLVSGFGGSCSSCGPARVWVCPDHLSWGSVCSADSASVCVLCSIGAWPTSQQGWRLTPGL